MNRECDTIDVYHRDGSVTTIGGGSEGAEEDTSDP